MQRRYPEGVPLLSPEEDMSVKESAFRKAQRWAFRVCSRQYDAFVQTIVASQEFLAEACKIVSPSTRHAGTFFHGWLVSVCRKTHEEGAHIL